MKTQRKLKRKKLKSRRKKKHQMRSNRSLQKRIMMESVLREAKRYQITQKINSLFFAKYSRKYSIQKNALRSLFRAVYTNIFKPKS